MKKVSPVINGVLSAICLSLVFSGCGGGGGNSGSGTGSGACNAFKVLNGVECTADVLPVVALRIENVGDCTGTVISNDAVLTAAHCVAGGSGAIAGHDHGTQVAVGGFYNKLARTSSAYDIGILVFPNIATNLGIRPAHFGLTRRTAVGDHIKIIGYGQDGTAALINDDPRAISLTVAGVTDGFVSTLFDANNAGPCHGDSGGAATLNGLIVASVQGRPPGSVENCAEGSTALFVDLQIEGNVDFIKRTAPGAVFE